MHRAAMINLELFVTNLHATPASNGWEIEMDGKKSDYLPYIDP